MFKNVDITYKNAGEILDYLEKQLQSQAGIHYKKGVKYFLDEELDKAIREWEKTLQLNPEHLEAKRDLEKTRRLLEKLRKFQ